MAGLIREPATMPRRLPLRCAAKQAANALGWTVSGVSADQTWRLRTDQTKLSYQKWSREQAMNGARNILMLPAPAAK